MDLLKLREHIDYIDKKIVDLYEERMEVSSQIADYKIETGKKVFDKDREKEKIRTLRAMSHNEFNSIGIEELFSLIMSTSRKLQYQKLTEKASTRKGHASAIRVQRGHTRRPRQRASLAIRRIYFMWIPSGMHLLLLKRGQQTMRFSR